MRDCERERDDDMRRELPWLGRPLTARELRDDEVWREELVLEPEELDLRL